MSEVFGIVAAMASSAMGGAAIVATRYVAGVIDPLALGALRFGVGVLLLTPLALSARTAWPAKRDWPRTVALGLLFFALFPALFNASLQFTTAARGALALSTLPLLTMVVAAVAGAERMTVQKTVGVLIAVGGVAVALFAGLAHAPAGAWKGDLLMVGAAACMALYSVGSRPVIARSNPLSFTAMAMGVGALALVVVSAARGGFAPLSGFGVAQWSAVAYLGVFGGAVVFYLWAYALARTTPTRVAVSVTVNPVTAALVGAVILDEAIHWNLLIGLAGVLVGIGIAMTAPGGARLNSDS